MFQYEIHKWLSVAHTTFNKFCWKIAERFSKDQDTGRKNNALGLRTDDAETSLSVAEFCRESMKCGDYPFIFM